jgi:hypothetical protein
VGGQLAHAAGPFKVEVSQGVVLGDAQPAVGARLQAPELIELRELREGVVQRADRRFGVDHGRRYYDIRIIRVKY